MTGGPNSERKVARNSIPAAVQELSLWQGKVRGKICDSIESISSELAGPIDREGRLELAATIADISEELRDIHEQKIDADYFHGREGISTHLQERGANLQSDHRRLLNELRSAQQETVGGKARKAHRQLTSWLNHYSDLLDRETELIPELWG